MSTPEVNALLLISESINRLTDTLVKRSQIPQTQQKIVRDLEEVADQLEHSFGMMTNGSVARLLRAVANDVRTIGVQHDAR